MKSTAILSNDERAALRAFRAQQGRQYKLVLGSMWLHNSWYGTNTNVPVLGQLCDRLGVLGIGKLRLINGSQRHY